jgi:Tol biopolymer transport system component
MNANQTRQEPALESWKEIARYLQKDTTTAQRWEKEEGLPVHRHTHKTRSSVYAYPSEIDAWRASRKVAAEPIARPVWKIPAFALTMLLCLVMVGNGIRPTIASAQGSTGSVATRQVWTLPPRAEIFGGAVSPDGRYIPYIDWAPEHHGDLFLHDLTTGNDRRLTNTAGPGSPSPEDQFAEEASFSRDGRQLAYTWFDGKKDRYEIRLVNLEGTAVPTFRKLFDNEDIFWVVPYDWSPDGKWIAVRVQRKGRSVQIGLVAVRDGSLRVLKSVDWRGPSRMSFSIDSKYLAYDLPASDTSEERDIFLLAIDGSRESAAVVHPSNDTLVSWSPEGQELLFASDRRGSRDLWALPVREGKPASEPYLLKRDLGEMEPLGLTATGKLYSIASNLGTDIQVGAFDLATGRVSAPVPAVQTFVGSNQAPDWSPDGRFLAYLSHRGSPSERRFVIGIRSIEDGQTREIAPAVRQLDLGGGIRWSADGRSFLGAGEDLKGRNGIFRIDAQTGRISEIVTQERGGISMPVESNDGKSLYYRKALGPEAAFLKRDLATGNERQLIRETGLGALFLSPDGRYIAASRPDPATKSSILLLIPAGGGEPKELMRRTQPEIPTVYTWTPDSMSILARIVHGQEKGELWRVPIDGHPPVKLDATVENKVRVARVHSDGRQIAFQVNEPPKPTEVWVTENFLPKAAARR